MTSLFASPFETPGVPPRWDGGWEASHGAAHLASDLATAAACAGLVVMLTLFARRRKDVRFRRLVWLSCAFLIACATARVADALLFWHPAYWLQTLLEFVTAGTAWAALLALLPLVPRVLALRSPQELEAEVERRVQELRDTEARTRAIVETAADGIITLDDDGIVQSANQACQRLFGVGPDEMIGQPVTRFLVSAGLDGPPQPSVGTGEQRVFELGEEAVGRRADGSTFPTNISMGKTHTHRGGLVTVIVHDLSVRKKIEEALRHSEARLRMVLNQVPAILCSTDQRLHITLLTCSVGTGLSGLGLNLPRFSGTSLEDTEAPAYLPAPAFARALQGESVTAEVQWEDRILEFHIDPLRGQAGAIVGAVGVGLDVTEHKRVETAQEFYAAQLRERNEALSRSNQELDEFAYVASHDLKEPLRGIHNYASFLIEDYADRLNADGRAKLETLKQLSQRMDTLIESLLQFSRVGRVDLAVQETDLNEVVEEVLASLQISLEERGVEVRFARTLPCIRCDRVRIAEVFRNLITNAMKYNDKPQQWVEIGVADKAPPGVAGPVFFVRDNGIGIPPQHHEAVFRIFKRLHGRDKFGGGAGAGLTIVKKIIERHGGKIWVDSTPGEGSTFSFTVGDKAAALSAALIR